MSLFLIIVFLGLKISWQTKRPHAMFLFLIIVFLGLKISWQTKRPHAIVKISWQTKRPHAIVKISWQTKRPHATLSHKKADTHININVEFGDDKGQISIDTIARKAEEGRYNKKVT